jgi:hypothetical protein
LPELIYPFHDREVLVTACGRLCLHRKRINISTVLAGQKLGIKEVDDGIWLVSFMHYDLGYFDLEQKTLQPLDNPFGTRLSPMSQVRPVTHVSGLDKNWGGGAGGIRTLDRPLQAYNGLANRRLQPLGHSSMMADMPDTRASRKRQIWVRPCPFGGAAASGAACAPGPWQRSCFWLPLSRFWLCARFASETRLMRARFERDSRTCLGMLAISGFAAVGRTTPPSKRSARSFVLASTPRFRDRMVHDASTSRQQDCAAGFISSPKNKSFCDFTSGGVVGEPSSPSRSQAAVLGPLALHLGHALSCIPRPKRCCSLISRLLQ